MFSLPQGFTDPAEPTQSDAELAPITEDEAAEAAHFDQEWHQVHKTRKPRISQDRVDNGHGFRSWRLYWPCTTGTVRTSEHDYRKDAQEHLDVLYQAGVVERP